MMTIEKLVSDHEQSLSSYARSISRSEEVAEQLVSLTWQESSKFIMLFDQMKPKEQRSWLFSTLNRKYLELRQNRSFSWR
jgi:DNA-directed RNA polymerase specialized sigma24 family protein